VGVLIWIIGEGGGRFVCDDDARNGDDGSDGDDSTR